MNCPKHPKYSGKSRPSGDCSECWEIWRSKQLSDPVQIIKKMMTGQFSLKELGVTESDIRHLRDRGYRIHHQINPAGKKVYYVATQSENTSFLISKASRKELQVKWLELSDLHFGSKQFDETGLREILQRATDEGYLQVHISGDLHDGYKVYPGHLENLRYWQSEDQAKYCAEVLSDYPLEYFAIKGNHDHSYEKFGGINPIFLVQQAVPSFTYLDSFAGDLIIAGVLKRMVHIDGGRAYAKSYPGQTYVRNLLDAQGEHIYVQGNKYRLRFLQLGHLHTDVMFEAAGIKVTHPGNFQFPNDYTTRRGLVGPQGARFTEANINKGQIVDYRSTFVQPKRH